MAIREGRWDCTQCNTTGIRGRERVCPNCGDPRNQLLDPEEAPYLPEDAPPVTDEEGLRMAAAGSNWNCGKCGHANLGTETICSNCGEKLDFNDDVVPEREYVDPGTEDDVQLSTPEDLRRDRDDAVIAMADPLRELEKEPMRQPRRTLLRNHLRRSGNQTPPDEASTSRLMGQLQNMSHGRRLTLAIVAALVILIAGWFGARQIYVNYFKTTEITLTVQDLRWERGVEVEVQRTLTLEDWNVPGDGRILSSSRQIRRYDRVLDHYETRTRQVSERVLTGYDTERYVCGTVDNGNGFFQDRYCTRSVPRYDTRYRTETYREPIYRNDPVYDTKYVYQVDRWVTDRFVRASGETNPYWPSPDGLGPRQRVGDERTQRYIVILTDPRGRSHNRTTDNTTWSRLQEGETVRGHQARSGSVRRVDWPQQ